MDGQVATAGAKLIDKLGRSLPTAARRLVVALKHAAERESLNLYLVGGCLRDLLLGRAIMDLDLTVEGDADALARPAAAWAGLRCVVHAAFATAKIKGEGFLLDVAAARSESYARPGALPAVRPATIREDLERRDFSVNAMALALTGPRRGELIDPCGGTKDLERRLVRVLHERSFVEDATRILRAVRYEVRLGFRLEERTESWLKRDVGYLNTISGARLRQELSRILAEARPEDVLRQLDELGALAAIHPALACGESQAEAMARLRSVAPAALPAACWPLLLAPGASRETAVSLPGRLALTQAQTAALTAMPELRSLERRLSAPGLRPSAVVEVLSPYPPAALWALAALTDSDAVRERGRAYLRRWRYVKPSLDGHALLSLGLGPGPAVGEALRRLRAARLDGEVKSRRDEERLARSLVESRPREASLQADDRLKPVPRTSAREDPRS